MEFTRKENDYSEVGKVKHVGKHTSKDKDSCWIAFENGTTERMNFLKEISHWKYLEENRISFAIENTEINLKNSSPKNDENSEGVFYLMGMNNETVG